MSNVKCINCGLINWPDATACKRCGTSLVDVYKPKPPVMKWFDAYCIFMAVMYLICAGMGIVFLVLEPTGPDVSLAEVRITGIVFTWMGFLMAVPFAIGAFMPRKSWTWVFGLILICIGLTSLCCLPATIPLLIHWIKPETKLYFGRT